MKLLCLFSDVFSTFGGIQTFNKCFLKVISDIAKKKDIDVVVLSLNDDYLPEIANRYVESERIYFHGCKKSKLFFLRSFINNVKEADKVILGHLNFLPLALFRDTKPTVEKILTIHGIEAWKKLNFFLSYALSNISKIISVSQYTASRFQVMNNLLQGKFQIIPLTIDPFFASDIKLFSRKELSLPEGKIILTVSRLDKRERYKNIDLVIKSLPNILKTVPDVGYVVIGEGSDKGRLQMVAKQHNVEDKVIFLGSLDEELLPSYYNSCDIFLLPSTKEGFGVVFLEAMSFGKPCIGVNSGAISEVISHGKTGFLVEPNNPTELAKIVVKILSNQMLLSTIGQAGKEKFDTEFSYENFRYKLQTLLNGR